MRNYSFFQHIYNKHGAKVWIKILLFTMDKNWSNSMTAGFNLFCSLNPQQQSSPLWIFINTWETNLESSFHNPHTYFGQLALISWKHSADYILNLLNPRSSKSILLASNLPPRPFSSSNYLTLFSIWKKNWVLQYIISKLS